jgi:hypothetical protein
MEDFSKFSVSFLYHLASRDELGRQGVGMNKKSLVTDWLP